MQPKKILVVDDEPEHCLVVSQALNQAGYETMIAHDGPRAIALSREERYDLHLLDIRMQPLDGLKVLQTLRNQRPDAQAIMLSAFGDIDVAVKCMKLGAYDFLAKPINLGELLITVGNALKSLELQQEVATLRSQLEIQQSPDQLLGESAPMQELMHTLEQVGRHNLTIMIRGESGTGKELTARALHSLSPRRHAPFVSVDCATLPETLVESELFGYERGAFTGAVAQKIGRFEQALDGTLFLDEIGNLPLSVQVKLLRVLQERHFNRLGGKAEHPFHATIVTATNVDLEKAIREGRFREDLYYRLNEFILRLPPLRSRHSDIALLIKHFLDVFNRQFGKNVEGVSPAVMSLFMNYAWPGNVRELKNVIKRGVVLAEACIETTHLPEGTFITRDTLSLAAPYLEQQADTDGMSLKEIVRRETTAIEKRVILQTLEATRWNRSLTAKKLAIDYKTLYNKMKELQIG